MPNTITTKDMLSAQFEPASYEAGVEELEALLRLMESAQLPLDQLLTSYQRGAFLLDFCQGKLQTLEQQISRMDNGQLKPWQGVK
jgi:exodeoxyribonuclease VII small subunit